MKKHCFNDRVLEDLLFFADRNEFVNPFWVKAGSAKLGCYFLQNDPDAVTIVHFHGNGETVKNYLNNIGLFLFFGFNFFFVEYRGYGMSTGKASLAKLLGDVDSVFEGFDVPLEKIVVYGRSFGSLCALHAVWLYPKIKGLILESGLANLSGWRVLVNNYKENMSKEACPGRLFEDLDNFFDNKTKLSSFQGSTLLFHCQNDRLIPLSHARKLFNWANKPKQLKMFRNGEHSSYIIENFPEYKTTLSKFIKSLNL